MRATGAALDEAGLYHAGAGEREGLARMAAYMETAGGAGRIALVAAALGFRPTTNALSEHGAAPGRPGVSALACDLQRLVPADQLDELGRVSCRFRHPEDPARCDLPSLASAPISALGSRFSVADMPAANYTSRCEFNDADSAALLRSLREARQDSDFVALLLGGSLPGYADTGSSTPPPGLVKLAHAAVDAGAGLVAMTGGAGVGPIEIYRPGSGLARPILYGMGYLYWSPAAAPRETPDSWQSMLVRSHATVNGLNIEIYPLDLRSAARNDAGTPRLADREAARDILGKVQDRSASFGTKVEIEAYGNTLRGRIVVVPGMPAAVAAPTAGGGAGGRE
jgi:Bacterial capsule synthesis protein PGA_cap